METLRYVLLANGLLAVVSLAFYALLRRETFFEANRFALWLGLVAALLLPVLELPDWRPQPVRTIMQRTAQVIVPKVLPNSRTLPPDVTITFPNGRTYSAVPRQETGFSWTWQLLVMGLYVAGAFGRLLRFSFQIRSLMRLIRHSTHEVYDDFTLVSNELVTSPFSFFGWVVVNPNQHTPSELDQILRHERVHVRARHSVDMVVAELVCIVFWFNPAAYLFRRLLHQTLEFSADRAVLAEGVDSKAYQYNLLKVSLLAEQATIMAQFSGSMLRHRISMINRSRSGLWAAGRYVLWAGLLGLMALACRHGQKDEDAAFTNTRTLPFPLTNATRRLAAELEKADMPWFRQSDLIVGKNVVTIKGRQATVSRRTNYPEILCLKNNHLSLKLPDYQPVKIFINGQQSTAQLLSVLTFDEVDDLLVYQKWEDAHNADKFPEMYRIFVSTTHKTPEENPTRRQWKQYLQANAVSDYPLGKSNTFSMNKLLEATFFNNKFAFVKRTKDDHLMLLDEYTKDIDLYINGLPVDAKKIEGVHVREVDRLYTGERPFDEWMDGPNRKRRFALYIQTSPKRAKRDSSYYVFSPFYSGDF